MLFEAGATVSWRRPSPALSSLAARALRFVTRAPARPPATMAAAVQEFGLPAIPDTTPDQELVGLLRCAAAVEHGLMAQYLFAAYSLKTPGSAAVLLRIAIEEMGHLLTVQNLLVGAGAEPFLGRYDWEPQLALKPFDLVLEAASRGSIAKYAACEMPAVGAVDDDDQDILPDVLKDAHAAAHIDPVKVGLLYAKIYWLLRTSDGPAGAEPWSDFPVEKVLKEVGAGRHVSAWPLPGSAAAQADRADWSRYQPTIIVASAADRDGALLAVKEVSEQGEGFGSHPDGHFDRFVGLYRVVRDVPHPSLPVLTGPWHARSSHPGAPEGEITRAQAAALAGLADDVYELCLLAIAFHHHLPSAAGRSRMAKAALDLMSIALKKLGRQLLRMSARSTDVAQDVASLCFGRPSVDTPAGYEALRTRMREVCVETIARADAISGDPTFDAVSKLAVKSALDGAVRPLLAEIEASPPP